MWSVLFGVVVLACFLLCVVAAFVPGWWLPHLANKDGFGWDIDFLFYAILFATGFFFVLTEVILVYAMWKFTWDPAKKATYTHGNHRLEILWTAVPAVILLLIAFGQIPAWEKIKYRSQFPEAPDQVMEVSARQFEWRMRYPNEEASGRLLLTEQERGLPDADRKAKADLKQGDLNKWGKDNLSDIEDVRATNEVHSWHNANTLIYLKTRDVLHSFYLPNLRLKQDAVPGKTIPVWFKANDWNTRAVEVDRDVLGPDGLPVLGSDGTPLRTRVVELQVTPGKEWELACAELCGWGHYKMRGHLYIHENKESYLRWREWAWKNQQSHTREPNVVER